MPPVGKPGLAAARRAAVAIATDADQHLGHGLLLSLPSRGSVVLTCHHVVVDKETQRVREDVRVIIRDDKGAREAVGATFDESASRPEHDVAVLAPERRIALDNPLLHVPDARHYDGRLPATALSPGSDTENFQVMLQTAGEVMLPVAHPPGRYHLETAFALGGPEDVTEGVSGSSVLCEEGVVGLIHFARDQTPQQKGLGYLNPVTAWSDGLPELADMIEPFTSRMLRRKAAVLRALAIAERGPLRIAGYRPGVYLPRTLDEEAKRAFEEGDLLCLIGKAKSGKTRLVCQLLQGHEDAMVVLPHPTGPPPDLGDDSVFRERDVVLLFENVHLADGEWQPLEWRTTFLHAARRVLLVLTGNADDWKRVENALGSVLRYLEPHKVYLSEPEPGADLSREEGLALAELLGMSEQDFAGRFDGTPGSLLVDDDSPPAAEREQLPPGEQAGTAIGELSLEDRAQEIPTNLPALSSSFVGRERERADLAELVDTCPLVTITGLPGTGKTRIALRVACEAAPKFPDGVWWVDLTEISEGEAVVPTVARSLPPERHTLADDEDELVKHLRSQRALVVLDGPDHALNSTAGLAARITGTATPVRLLVVSQDPLGLPWERVYALPPLSSQDTPEDTTNGHPSSPAHRLFLDRAGIASEAALSDDERSRVDGLCRDLHGNAAALEITAAHVREAGLEVVSAAVSRSAPRAPEALDVAVAHSLEGHPERAALFARLAVFPSWFTLAAARDVTAGADVRMVPGGLRDLVDQALVRIETRDPDAERYRLLAGVRDLARSLLEARGEVDEVHRRHAEHYLALAEYGVPRLYGRAAERWQERLVRERANFRAALRWTIAARERALAWGLGAALWHLLLIRSRFAEGRRWLDELILLAPPGGDHQLSDPEATAFVRVLTGAGYLAYHQADYDAARALNERALALGSRVDVGSEFADVPNILGLIARRRCDFDVARQWLHEAITISERHNDLPRLADQLNSLANALREERGDLDEAMELQERSFALYTRLGSARGCAMAQCDLAYLLTDRGELGAARLKFARSLATRRRIEDLQGEGQSLNGLARVDRREGEVRAARERHEAAREMFDDMGDELRVAESLEGLAAVHLQVGHEREGQELLERADVVRSRVGAPRPPALLAEIDELVGSPATAGP